MAVLQLDMQSQLLASEWKLSPQIVQGFVFEILEHLSIVGFLGSKSEVILRVQFLVDDFLTCNNPEEYFVRGREIIFEVEVKGRQLDFLSEVNVTLVQGIELTDFHCEWKRLYQA